MIEFLRIRKTDKNLFLEQWLFEGRDGKKEEILDIINQTNRTILFEEINPEKLDLLTIVGSAESVVGLEDAKIDEINEHLLVKSFDEFLKKFEPKVYSFFNAATQKIHYTLRKPDNIPEENITIINLNMENSFLKMLSTLVDARKSQGNKNTDFKFENILDMLSPKKVMDDIRQLRKEISYLYDKHEELEEGNPAKLELGDKLNLAFEKASTNYNNVLGMLPLAIEDIKTRVLLGQGDGGNEAEEIKLGVLTMGTQGELQIIESQPDVEEGALAKVEDNNSTALAEIFKDDYETINETPNDYISDLVIRTFVPLPATISEINYELEVNNYNQYIDFYKNAQEDFVKVSKPLMEKILGIKMYFDQYETKSKNMVPSLLVTNIKLDMLIKGNNKFSLESYLNTTNNKNDFENTIWLGIVPNIDMEGGNSKKNIRKRFAGTKEVKSSGNTMESLTSVMDICKTYKIQVFFNLNANDKTTFSNMSTEGVAKYVDQTQPLQNQSYSEYLVACMPNFTIIPKEKSAVLLDYKMRLEDAVVEVDKDDLIKFWIEGVYVDASYVAAGLTAAYQCPDYLRGRYKKVSSQAPGVRLNIESGDNSLKIRTILAKEISGYTTIVKDEINRSNFGYVFSSESAKLGSEVIKNITVYKARTLMKNEEGIFEPLYKTLTTTYIERILRFVTGDFKEDKLMEFFSSSPRSQKSKWMKDTESINSVIQAGDDVKHTIEDDICQLHLSFNGDVKNLAVDITKD